MKLAVAYYRVSTHKQGHSGLGLDAQKFAVQQFAEREGYNIASDFTEVESGKKDDRPQLLAALAQCKKQRAMLIIAKLDRLGRRVSFIANLMESKVDFCAVDNPHASKTMLHMMAVFAEHERDLISQRTKEGLAAAKRKGVVLGRNVIEVLAPQNVAAGIRFAEQTRPAVEAIQRDGFKSIRAICRELNQRGVPTYSGGGAWHYPSVRTLLKRIETHTSPEQPQP